jgi:hypothetical protein
MMLRHEMVNLKTNSLPLSFGQSAKGTGVREVDSQVLAVSAILGELRNIAEAFNLG